jgi:localization factor PodJL
MKPGIPWSVKGIEPELREVAKHAARKSGMTLGEWLNTVISEQADGSGQAQTASLAPPAYGGRHGTESFDRAASRLEDIATQLASIARRETGATANYVYQPEARAHDTDQITRILTRVESNERQTVEAFSAVNERLTVMGRQVTQAVQQRPEDQPGFQALEKAVRNIVEHLESSEKRTRDNLKSMQERLADMSSRAAAAPNDQVLRQAPAFSQLESRLSELAMRVEQAESSPARAMPDLLKTELQHLANRIETVRDTAEALASKAQTQAVQAGQVELRAIESRILGLLKEAQSTISSNSASPAEMLRLRDDVDVLNQRIDASQNFAASDQDVQALRSVVEQLSSRVAQGPDLRPVAELDRRVSEIAQRLQDSHGQAQSQPQFEELEYRVADLDQRLNAALDAKADGGQSSALEQKIAEFAARMDRTEQQLSHLETIERAINQLYDGLEQNRNATQQIAEDAALKATQQLIGTLPQQAPLGSAPELVALQQGLLAVREAAQISDQRGQETLEALHETLEHIVNKLNELETAAIGHRMAAAVAPTGVANALEQAQPDSFTNFAAVIPPAPTHAAPAHAAPVAPQFDDVEPEAQNPFEPKLDLAEPQADETSEETPTGDDFIAAARRAAQAAQQQRGLMSGLSAPHGRAHSAKPARRSLLGKFKFKSKATAAAVDAQAAAAATAAPATDGKRRKLILLGLVLLAAVSAFSFNIMGNQKSFTPPRTNQGTSDKVTPAPAVPAQAQPTKPKLGQLDGVLQSPMQGAESSVAARDEILTGSLPSSTAGLGDIVAGRPDAAAALPMPEVGSEKLRQAAANGDAQAQFVVATHYMNGENVTRDFAQAAFWYGKAAEAGLAPAQYRVATLYERGKGVAKDAKAALGWYEKAGVLGNIRAMHNAAVISAGKEAGAPDYAAAHKWFSLAANHGLKDSQFNLAVILERGLGTKANAAEAYFWYLAAARQNDADAQKRAEVLAKTLPADVAAATRARSENFVAESAPDAANVVAVNEVAWGSTENPPSAL